MSDVNLIRDRLGRSVEISMHVTSATSPSSFAPMCSGAESRHASFKRWGPSRAISLALLYRPLSTFSAKNRSTSGMSVETLWRRFRDQPA